MRNELVPRVTLIEILLGLMIILIFIAITISFFTLRKVEPVKKRLTQQTQPDTPQVAKIKSDTLIITNALKFFKFDNGFYPSTEQGLQALFAKPTTPPIPIKWSQYLKSIPLDPWGRPYRYVNTGIGIKVYVIDQKPRLKQNFVPDKNH